VAVLFIWVANYKKEATMSKKQQPKKFELNNNQKNIIMAVGFIIGVVIVFSLFNSKPSDTTSTNQAKPASTTTSSAQTSSTESQRPKNNYPLDSLPGFNLYSHDNANDPSQETWIYTAEGHKDIEVILGDSGDPDALYTGFTDNIGTKTVNSVQVTYGYKDYNMDPSKTLFHDNDVGFKFIYNSKTYSASVWVDGTGKSDASDLNDAFNRLLQDLTS
jgi:hypothetical protein